jgi:cell division septum initiation protein DivIVA
MDILHLVDRLEQLINESRRWPLTTLRMVEEEAALNLIDQMRVAVPEEIKKAKRVQQEKDRILAQAQEEADHIKELGREEAKGMVARDAIVQAAEARAQTIVERAQRDADVLKRDADDYCLQVLSELDKTVTAWQGEIRGGVTKLQRERIAAATAEGAAAHQAALKRDQHTEEPADGS